MTQQRADTQAPSRGDYSYPSSDPGRHTSVGGRQGGHSPTLASLPVTNTKQPCLLTHLEALRTCLTPFPPTVSDAPWHPLQPCSSVCWSWQSLKAGAGRQPAQAAICIVSNSGARGSGGMGGSRGDRDPHEAGRAGGSCGSLFRGAPLLACFLPAFNVTVRSDRQGTCQGSHVAQACMGHCESSAFPSRYSVLVASSYRHNLTSISQCCTIRGLKKVRGT